MTDETCNAVDITGESPARYQWVCELDKDHDRLADSKHLATRPSPQDGRHSEIHEWYGGVTYPVTGAPLLDPLPTAEDERVVPLIEALEDMDAVAESHGEPLLRTFRFEHLPRGPIRSLSAEFAGLATIITEYLPGSAERTTALRHIWDANNYAVFAASELQRGKPDEDGYVVGAERQREGSSETVEAQHDVQCGSSNSTTTVGIRHHCAYADGHSGWHRCVCGQVWQ